MSSSEDNTSGSEVESEEEVKAPPPRKETGKKSSAGRKSSASPVAKKPSTTPTPPPAAAPPPPAAKKDDDVDIQRKMDEKEKRKAEVRARLQAQSQNQGFLTPERKKRLKAYIMKKAREEMMIELKKKEEERKKMLAERVKPLPDNLDSMTDDQVKSLCREFLTKIKELETLRYDWEENLRKNDEEINKLTNEVNNLRGRYVKPTLKKTQKYDHQFGKLKKTLEVPDWRNNLKKVESNKWTIDIQGEETKSKPEWAGSGATQAAAE